MSAAGSVRVRVRPLEAPIISAVAATPTRVLRRPALAARLRRWVVADVHAALAIALVVPVLIGEAVHAFAGSGPPIALSAWFLGSQVVLGLVTPGRDRGVRRALRLILAVAYVGLLTLVEPRTEATLPVLYVPTITLAAAMGARTGIIVAIVAAATARLAIAVEAGPSAAIEQSIVPIVVVAFIAVGTRHIVASLERSVERFRDAVAAERRRARRMQAIEQVGYLLAQDGPSPAALEAIMDILVGTFGYHYPSVYLWTGATLRLGAQRGYAHPIEEFDAGAGIIGRVARTREPMFVPDVTRDADYMGANPDVVSEISVPLLHDGDLLGVLNVESSGVQPLDRDDLASMRTIADRLAVAIALGRERRKLTERTDLLDRLIESAGRLSASLDTAEVATRIVDAARYVVGCDAAILVLSDIDGAFRIAAVQGLAETIVGRAILPGEGAAGRAIASGKVVIDDDFDRSQFPKVGQEVLADLSIRVMGLPIARDDIVIGAITMLRRSGDGFSEQEREIGQLMAAHTSLALGNATLHAAATEAAVRDPLTGLHNRRFLDATVARASAGRGREKPDQRRPVAAILFDLDHFGALNKQFGHQVGDSVLRAFSDVLRQRFRSSDLVARYGGEEFLVVLEGASRDDAVRAAEDVRLAFRAVEVAGPGGTAVRATVSAGCAALDPAVADLASMIETADVGLAMAKSGGRDQVVAA